MLAHIRVLNLGSLPRRFCTLAPYHVKPGEVELSDAHRARFYPRIGSRKIVGPGHDCGATYVDRYDMPYPAIRFREDTGEIADLRKKELGDWKNISLEDKKKLYRASFRQTLAELYHADGSGFYMAHWACLVIATAGCLMIYGKLFVLPLYNYDDDGTCHNVRPDWWSQEKHEQRLKFMIDSFGGYPSRAGSGWVTRNWDYETMDWRHNVGKPKAF